MKLQISTPVLVTLIAAFVYLAAQQPPRQNRERVERTPKPDKPDGKPTVPPIDWIERKPFNPRHIQRLEQGDS